EGVGLGGYAAGRARTDRGDGSVQVNGIGGALGALTLADAEPLAESALADAAGPEPAGALRADPAQKSLDAAERTEVRPGHALQVPRLPLALNQRADHVGAD